MDEEEFVWVVGWLVVSFRMNEEEGCCIIKLTFASIVCMCKMVGKAKELRINVFLIEMILNY